MWGGVGYCNFYTVGELYCERGIYMYIRVYCIYYSEQKAMKVVSTLGKFPQDTWVNLLSDVLSGSYFQCCSYQVF